MRYVRYADDFLIGVIGSRQDAEQILSDVRDFLARMGLTASPEKTKVTKATTGTRFLGTTCAATTRSRSARSCEAAATPPCGWAVAACSCTCRPRSCGRSRVNAATAAWTRCVRAPGRRCCTTTTSKSWPSTTRRCAASQFYALAYGAQSGQMHKLHFLWRSSLLMTLGHKHKRSIAQIKRRLRTADGRLAVPYQDAKGRTRALRVWELSDLKRTPQTHARVDSCSQPLHLLKSRTSLIARWKAAVCEQCGTSDRPVEVHHVRKVSDLQGTPLWQRTRSERLRKTVVLCVPCHKALHAGRLPDNRKS